MCLLDDRLRIVDVGAAKNNVRNGDQQRLFVDGIQQALGRDVDAVVGLDHVYLRAVLSLRFPEIHYRREVQIAVDNFVSLGAEIKAGGNHRLTCRHILVHGD